MHWIKSGGHKSMNAEKTIVQVFCDGEYDKILEKTCDLYRDYSYASRKMGETIEKKELIRDSLTTKQKIMMVILFPLLGFFIIFYYFHAKKENEQYNEELKREIRKYDTYKSNRDKCSAEILECHKQFCVSSGYYIPMRYFHPDALNSFEDYFRTGRASDLKEAMNLYEEEQHRMRLENMQSEALRQAQIANNLALQSNVISAANVAANIVR